MVSASLGAITQAVIIAVTLIALGIAFYNKIGYISNEISNISDAVSQIDTVDLKQMEKSILRLSWEINEVENVDNSVKHMLKKSDLEVTISLASDRYSSELYDSLRKQTGVKDFNKGFTRKDVSIINFEFSEAINMREIENQVPQDQDIIKKQRELFGREGQFKSTSPYEIVFAIPSDDYDSLGEFINLFLIKVDKFNIEFEEKSAEFDSTVKSHLREDN